MNGISRRLYSKYLRKIQNKWDLFEIKLNNNEVGIMGLLDFIFGGKKKNKLLNEAISEIHRGWAEEELEKGNIDGYDTITKPQFEIASMDGSIKIGG